MIKLINLVGKLNLKYNTSTRNTEKVQPGSVIFRDICIWPDCHVRSARSDFMINF